MSSNKTGGPVLANGARLRALSLVVRGFKSLPLHHHPLPSFSSMSLSNNMVLKVIETA